MRYESIRYSGSKNKILPKIDLILEDISLKNVLDGFSGSTRVSQFFKHKGFVTTSNDMAIYSKHIAECYLLARQPHSYYKSIVDHLNSLTPTVGWFSINYGGYDRDGSSIQEDGFKRPFQMHVTEKLDAIRNEIDILYPMDCIDKSVLLTSLLLALDNVSNDMGHQVSYLKNWSSKTYKPLHLKVPNYVIDNLDHRVYTKNVFDVKDSFDLCYFDPPYGTSNEKTKILFLLSSMDNSM
jgi:adenine-specific DNA-methyltransferase